VGHARPRDISDMRRGEEAMIRPDRKTLGVRRDSLLVLATYIAAVALLTAVPG